MALDVQDAQLRKVIPNCSVIDLFCGVGGLTHGFVQEGFSVLAGVDVDGICKYAYEKNNGAKFIHRNIEDVKADELLALYPDGDTKILIGCAPCQPFSMYTRKSRRTPKWKLLEEFGDLIGRIKPDIVSMENVPNLWFSRTFRER